MRKKHAARILTPLLFTIALLGCVLSNHALINMENEAYAALNSESACVSGSGASNVASVQRACNYCFDPAKSNSARGTLWFNSSSSERNSDVVQVSDPNAATATLYLWGQTFACGQYPTSSTAYYIWFGGKNQDDNVSTQAVPYLQPNNASVSQYRGSGPGNNYVWLSLEPPTSGWTLNVQEFKTHPGTTMSITASGLERYEAEVSVNRCYSSHSDGYKSYHSDCYGENSKIILEIPAADASGFSSKSKVTVGSSTSVSPNWNQNAPTLEIEADASGNATVEFNHILQYLAGSPSGNYNEASTNWTITIDDGSGGPWTGTWSTPGGADAESGWLPESGPITTTVSLGTATSKTVCSTITYTPKTVQWDTNDPKNMIPNSDSGSTKACAKIVQSPVQQAGTIEFWSVSHVSSVRDSTAPDVVPITANTYDNINQTNKIDGDKVTLRLSTDFPSAHANFSHDLTYVIKLNYTLGANDKITGTNMCTTWTIESDTDNDGATGKKCASSGKNLTGSFIGVSTTTNHLVTIASKNTAEEKIKFEKKTVPVLRKEIKYSCPTLANPNRKCSYDPKRWEYYSEADTGSGQGSSAAKIQYENPPEPDGDGPETKGAGSAESSPIYAGEEGDMIWRAHAKPTETRRVDEYQSVAFLVQVSKALDPNSTKSPYLKTTTYTPPYKYNSAQDRNKNAPCDYWGGRLPLRTVAGGCQQVTSKTILNRIFDDSGNLGSTNESEVSLAGEQETMAVPDWVGDKYCNSFGYRWGYYHGIMNTKGSNAGTWTWTKDGQPYWVHYNASCRSIAKKPSVALWNGGLFVGAGNVVASTSPRRQNPQVAVPASSLSIRHYGSWSEYLANVNGSVGGMSAVPIPGFSANSGLFASAASYAWDGSSKTSAPENSPLTIQNFNSSTLGYSGVEANSALMARFKAYFEAAKTDDASTISLSNVNDSKIYFVNGDVRITGDGITVNTSLKSSIFQLPQVVIYSTGNINIDPGVKQIDAWLIAEGKIDTCYNSYTDSFIEHETQARVDRSSNPDGRSNACQDKLIINGPTLAKTITTTRSFGSDGTANTDEDSVNASNTRAVPAEVFNLSAENYLWAYVQAGRYNSSYTEAYSRELPPRY